jgi:hypothetical protein
VACIEAPKAKAPVVGAAAPAPAAMSTSRVDDSAVLSYQITLWISIVMIVCVYFGVYSLVTIDATMGQDALIYSSCHTKGDKEQ